MKKRLDFKLPFDPAWVARARESELRIMARHGLEPVVHDTDTEIIRRVRKTKAQDDSWAGWNGKKQ